MKDVTQDFIDNEEADKRKPAELYHIWRDGGEHWRYTDGDVDITFNSEDYTQATLSRGSVTYDNKLEVTTLEVKAPYIENPVLEYIATNPIEILWISVTKLHRDDLTEGDVVFIGQIKAVAFQGITASVSCVGFEHYLKKSIPTWRYQLNCNHTIFDTLCTLTESTYLTSTAIVLDATGTQLSSSDFGLESDGYFTGGEVRFGDEARTIVSHIGNTIIIMYKMKELVTTDTVSAYPGCDGRAETCRDKYSNIVHFLGFPFIPVENPALRITW